MERETLTLSVADHIAHVQLTRGPALNTMTPAFWDDMIAAFEAIDADGSARAVVLSSTGRHFTAGLDLESAAGLGSGEADAPRRNAAFLKHLKHLQRAFTVIDECRVPVVAAIQGGCIGGGVDMVTACDLRVAARDAFFTIQEINIGIVADVGTLQRAPYLLPHGILRELAYTGRRMGAEEAKGYGFVNRVAADHEAAVAEAFELAREIAAKSPVAILGIKRVLNTGRGRSVAEGLDYVGVWNAAFLAGDDLKEAIGAQMEKRAATFADLA